MKTIKYKVISSFEENSFCETPGCNCLADFIVEDRKMCGHCLDTYRNWQKDKLLEITK